MNKFKVMLGLITRDNDYQREQAAVAEATAKRLGIELQVLYAENDAIAQTKQILALIHGEESERPNALIVEPVGTGMPGVASAAAAKGVGWVLLNRSGADYLAGLRQTRNVPIGSVDSDNAEVGRIQARQFMALLPAGGSVLYIEGPATDVTKQRRGGVEEALPRNIELKALRGKWTEDSGLQLMSSRLQRHAGQPPDVDVVGCQNDAMAMGARKAVEALPPGPLREQWLKIPFTGVDGVPTTGKVWVDRGLLKATVVTPALAGVALELVTKALESGNQMPERTLSKVTSYPTIEELRARAASVPAR